MASLSTQIKFFTALLFCFALLSFLLSQATAHSISPSGEDAIAQAITPPPSTEQTLTPSSGEQPTAPIEAPAINPSRAPALEQPVTPPSGEQLAPAAPSGAPVTPSGTIKRLAKQQILASIPPEAAGEAAQPFIASPSGRYVGYLVRRETAPGAGGFGNDFCYLQVREAVSAARAQSVWESDCTPASTANACSLLFTDAGLEVFDGSRSSWDAGVDDEHLETLELVDEGDMRIRTRDGDLAWRASDKPLANQQCGFPGSPGLASAKPPFAAPVEDSRNLPFGQPSMSSQERPGTLFGQQPQQPPLNGFAQPVGVSSQQGLVDNTPFDSGCSRVYHCWFATALALLLTLLAYGFLF